MQEANTTPAEASSTKCKAPFRANKCQGIPFFQKPTLTRIWRKTTENCRKVEQALREAFRAQFGPQLLTRGLRPARIIQPSKSDFSYYIIEVRNERENIKEKDDEEGWRGSVRKRAENKYGQAYEGRAAREKPAALS